MIKIITGWSNAGGSTVAFINLTKALNAKGIPCTLYGAHQWHLDKCQSGMMGDLKLDTSDTLILHYYDPHWEVRPPISGKLIYSCHEKDIRPIKSFKYEIYDKIHFVSRPQKEWHDVDHPFFILPNIVDELRKPASKPKKVAGIIGSVDRNKQTHVSIKRAIDDGMRKVLLFGNISDQNYFNEIWAKYSGKFIYKGHINDKQKLYNQISDVYLSSLSETWSYLPKECEMTGTNFHGTDAIKDNFELDMTNEEIVDVWVKELEL